MVVVLAGGYGRHSWRYTARYVLWLASRREIEPAAEDDLALKRFRRLGSDLRYAETVDDGLPFSLSRGGRRRPVPGLAPPARFLGLYSRHGVELLLERSGCSLADPREGLPLALVDLDVRRRRPARPCASRASRTPRAAGRAARRAQPQRDPGHGRDRGRVAAAAEPAGGLLRRGGRGCPDSSTPASGSLRRLHGLAGGRVRDPRPRRRVLRGRALPHRRAEPPARAAAPPRRRGAAARPAAGARAWRCRSRGDRGRARAGSSTRTPADAASGRRSPRCCRSPSACGALVTGPEYEVGGGAAEHSRSACCPDRARPRGPPAARPQHEVEWCRRPVPMPRLEGAPMPARSQHFASRLRRSPGQLARGRRRRARSGPRPDATAPADLRPPATSCVVISVDQMRADYLSRFRPSSRRASSGSPSAGRSSRTRATATPAPRPAPGTRSCSPAARPRSSGIVGNKWYDRALRRRVYVVDDETVRVLGRRRPHLLARALRRRSRSATC